LMKQIRDKFVSTSTYKGGSIKGSIDHSIRHPRRKNGDSFYKWMLVNWLNIYLSSPEWASVADEITPYPLFASASATDDNFSSHISKKMILNCFVEDYFASDFLLKKSIASPILSATHIALRNIIRSTVPILPKPTNAKEEKIISRFLKTIYRVEKIKNTSLRHESVVPLLELAVPKFENIPISEIINLKAKDKFSSLGKLIEDSELTSPAINDLDTAKIFIDQLWAMGKQLSPSIPEATIGVLSNLPVPFISVPLGILSSINEIKGLISFKKDYSWFIVLSQLRELSKNADKDKT